MWGKLGFGLTVFLLALLWRAPADKVLHLAWPDELPAPQQVQGRLLDGEIGQWSINGTTLQDIQWQLRPGALLLLRLHLDTVLGLAGDSGSDSARLGGQAYVSLLASDELHLRDWRGVAPLEHLKAPLQQRYLPLDGRLELELQALDWTLGSRLPQSVEGQIRLRESLWKIGTPAALGDYQADLRSEEGVLLAELQALDNAKLELEGQGQMDAEARYSFQGRIKAKADTPRSVANQLKGLGRTDRQGWYPLSAQGQWR